MDSYLREGIVTRPGLPEGIAEEKAKIAAALVKGYAEGGLDGMKKVAYKLEGEGNVMMLASLIKKALREGELNGTKINGRPNELWSFGHYADDLMFKTAY